MSDLFNGIVSFTKTVQNTLNSYEIRKIGDKVQGYVMNFTDAEAKVREATNEDPWGPTGPQMQELAAMTFQYDIFPEIMSMLWKRMFQENKLAWRRVYKSLILLNYLLKNGSERVISTARDHIFEIRVLESYKYLDERGKDEGINIRHRVKLVIELLQDDELLRIERHKSKTEGKEKYQGFSKEDMLYKSGLGNKSSNFDNWNFKSYLNNGSELNNSGFDKNNSQREITAFDFAENRNNSNSPELGIIDKSQENLGDDDDFGEFSQARSNFNTQNNLNNKIQTSSINTSTTFRIPPLTPPAPNSYLKTKKTSASLSTVSKNNKNNNEFGDLLTLTKDNVANMSNLFSSDIDKTLFDISDFQQQPSIQSNNLNNIFDLVSAPTSVISTSNNDLFSSNTTLFTSNSFFDKSITSNQVQFNNFDTPTSNATNNSLFLINEIDFISTLNSNLSSPDPIKSTASIKTASSNNLTTIKLPNTWNDLKGKLNMDFENLSLRPQPPKQTPTLNQLQESKSTTIDKNSSLW